MKNTSDEFRAYIDYLRGNLKEIEQIFRLDVALKVVDALLETEVGVSNLVYAFRLSIFRSQLIDHVVSRVGTDESKQEEVAHGGYLILCHELSNQAQEETAHKIAAVPEAFLHLLNLNKQGKFIPWVFEEPLQTQTDAYWADRVRYYFAKGDFRRAWDELRKALKGFPNNSRDFHGKIFSISQKALETIAGDLFNAMVVEGKMNPLQDHDLISSSRYWMMPIYQTKMASSRRPAERHQRVVIPGWRYVFPDMCIADPPIPEDILHQWQKGIPAEGTVRLTREGAMFVKLAVYFRQIRNERRRQKYEQLLRGYNEVPSSS